MDMIQAMRQELQREMSTTRNVLERVPLSDPSWKPHPKSMAIGRLAQHLAEIAGWPDTIVNSDKLDLAGHAPQPVPTSNAELLKQFDADVAKSLHGLESATMDALQKPWSLAMGERIIFTLPKIEVLRTWVANHSIHHRGQMAVYLRLKDVAVPSIYGPTADTGTGM